MPELPTAHHAVHLGGCYRRMQLTFCNHFRRPVAPDPVVLSVNSSIQVKMGFIGEPTENPWFPCTYVKKTFTECRVHDPVGFRQLAFHRKLVGEHLEALPSCARRRWDFLGSLLTRVRTDWTLSAVLIHFFLPEKDFCRFLTLLTLRNFSVRERVVFLDGAILVLKWTLNRLRIKIMDFH